jgi:hypothetical protein
VATEQDAARDRVLAARADLGEQLQILEASGRAAIDIKAKVRRNPARAAAIAGGVGFLALRGPQRIVRRTRHAIFGQPTPMPKSMLPEEVDKTLRSFGDDGEKVRAALERDFALYAKQANKQRLSLKTILTVAVARPVLLAVSKRVVTSLFAPQEGDFTARLAEVRARAERGLEQVTAGAPVADATLDGPPADDLPETT